MAHDWTWVETSLPKELVSIFAQDALQFESQAEDSTVFGGSDVNARVTDLKTRASRHTWIPQSHWIAGFVMHYANLVNNENYKYDLLGIDGGQLQYGIYGVGGHYTWHTDYDVANFEQYPTDYRHGLRDYQTKNFVNSSSELVRKLSFSLQLTDPSEYEGGDLELVGFQGKTTQMKKGLGVIMFFDSRMIHRVTPVTKGERRSLVGWITGPRWK